jgi:hypothetical protein
MKLPKHKIIYYHVQKPTRFKAFDIIVDSDKVVKGFVVKENNWVGVFFQGVWDCGIHDFKYHAFNLEKGYTIGGQAYFFNKTTKELLMITGGGADPVKLRKMKKMCSDNAYKVLVDFMALPPDKQNWCHA